MAPRSSSFDPYRTFKFRVRLDQQVIAGVNKLSALARSVAANELKQGGDFLGSYPSPGMVSYEDVTLEQGWSADRTLEDWADQALRLHLDPAGAKNFKRSVQIDVYRLDGNPLSPQSAPALSFKLARCWVSRFVAMPELNADSGGIGIRSVTLKHEGWQRV
jgi:phage tail-like protein